MSSLYLSLASDKVVGFHSGALLFENDLGVLGG